MYWVCRFKDEPDIWLRYRKTHWEYFSTWVDNLLYVGHDATKYYDELMNLVFKLKGVQEPMFHLGGDFKSVYSPEPVLMICRWFPAGFQALPWLSF